MVEDFDNIPPPRADCFQVRLALFQAKKFVSEGSVSFADERDKNIETLLALDMTVDDVYEELMKLEVENYCSGPSDDRDTGDPQCIWEFGQIVKGREIYIKLKLTICNMVDISFHFPERPLYYHYKK